MARLAAVGWKVGDAHMTEHHCNFTLDLGGATADDLETLGDQVKDQIIHATGVALEWAVLRIGFNSYFEIGFAIGPLRRILLLLWGRMQPFHPVQC